MVVTHRVTVEEYLALPEGEKPYLEYVFGEVIAKNMGSLDHGDLVHALEVILQAYANQNGGRLGPEIRVEWELVQGWVFRLPDISYWAAGRPRRGRRAALPPTLAIEVVSPDDTLEYQRSKCRFYRDNGVDAAWLFDPQTRTAEVFEPGQDGVQLTATDTLQSTVLSGFEVDLAALFAVLDLDD
jgi:Uma2 family endonuclease